MLSLPPLYYEHTNLTVLGTLIPNHLYGTLYYYLTLRLLTKKKKDSDTWHTVDYRHKCFKNGVLYSKDVILYLIVYKCNFISSG